jgi:hypothetical protein
VSTGYRGRLAQDISCPQYKDWLPQFQCEEQEIVTSI